MHSWARQNAWLLLSFCGPSYVRRLYVSCIVCNKILRIALPISLHSQKMSLIVSVAIVAAFFGSGEWLRARIAGYPFDEAVKTVILDVVLSVEFCAA